MSDEPRMGNNRLGRTCRANLLLAVVLIFGMLMRHPSRIVAAWRETGSM